MESTFSCCAYCWKDEGSWEKILCFTCEGCQKKVHYDCIRGGQPSPLIGDTFFTFRCQACAASGKEEFVRSSMSWNNVVMLTLYNLQKTSQGMCGYFHWKTHIAAFIDQHWNLLFGYQRKKTTLWMGSVAGALSIGCPEYFLSGANVGQKGHWRLAQTEPPLPGAEKKKQNHRKKKEEKLSEPSLEKRRLCGENVLAAAVELKEKRSHLVETKELKKQKIVKQADWSEKDGRSPGCSRSAEIWTSSVKKSGEKMLSVKRGVSPQAGRADVSEELYLSDSQNSLVSSEHSLATEHSSVKSEVKDEDLATEWDKGDVMSMFEMGSEDDENLDMELMVEATENFIDPRPPSPDVGIILQVGTGHEGNKSTITAEKVPSLEPFTNARQPSGQCDMASDSDREGDEGQGTSREKSSHLLKRRKIDDTPPLTPPPMQLKRISVFEEGELLQKLNEVAAKQTLPPKLAQFRRKLICNQTNREFGLPVFDLEHQMDKLRQCDKSVTVASDCRQPTYFSTQNSVTGGIKETRDLDRFMLHDSNQEVASRSYSRFCQRLVGLSDDELTPVVSPYTTRILLPFIWRNSDLSHKPLKLRLLQEIQAFPHRDDPSWVQPRCYPIDYCYIRPEHVASVNALCREFFWPGIDVSECLQYPDFSCVVLYRKIVIAFAFMVPDRGYSEAYISFIFTHPEWRSAGIGTFMLYHLIQTCMGKDVLLHVSATNPAMLLYQKFGFKCQELILNFYYKYFPLNSRESTHAFLMRLSR